MKKITKCLRRSGAIILLFAAHSSNGQSVTYVGSETGLPANGYSVQNWSNPGVAKAYDIGGSEVYGSAGYYQIRPTPNSSPSDVIFFQADPLVGTDTKGNLAKGSDLDPV